MERQPLVSILLLSMNHEKFIEQSINSLKNQTYSNIEVLFLDNASSDKTFETGTTLLKDSGLLFRSYKNSESKSISSNLNFLLENSQGDYISPLSADDWFEKENISKKVEFLAAHKDVGAIFSNGWSYIESNRKLILHDTASYRRGHIYKELFTHPDAIFYVGVMYNRFVLEEVGKWDEGLLIEDVDLYVRIALKYKIDFIEEPLVYYRRTQDSVSKNTEFMLKGYHQYCDKYKEAKWINMKGWLSERYRKVAANYVDHKNNKDAKRFLKCAIKLNPIAFNNYRTLFYLLRKSILFKLRIQN